MPAIIHGTGHQGLAMAEEAARQEVARKGGKAISRDVPDPTHVGRKGVLIRSKERGRDAENQERHERS